MSAEAPAEALRRLPFTTWLRLQRMVEGSQTVCVLVGTEPMARSSAGLTVQTRDGQRAKAQGRGPRQPTCSRGSMFELDVSAREVACATGARVRSPPSRVMSDTALPDLSLSPSRRLCRSALYACLLARRSHAADGEQRCAAARARISRRGYELHRDDLVSIDISGLDGCSATPRAIGDELRRIGGGARTARARRACRPRGRRRWSSRWRVRGSPSSSAASEAAALAPLPIGILEKLDGSPRLSDARRAARSDSRLATCDLALKRWGIRTLGELAALPSADLAARLGQQALRLAGDRARRGHRGRSCRRCLRSASNRRSSSSGRSRGSSRCRSC